MAQTNRKRHTVAPRTHGGGRAKPTAPIDRLRRTLMSCMLWEKTFYEDAVPIADRLVAETHASDPVQAAAAAVKARHEFHIRHAPLVVLCALLSHPKHPHVVDTIADTISRPDELCELLALYWHINGEGAPVAAQLRKGLARAFHKFDEYQFAKYNRRDRDVRIRDVMFLVHPKPETEAQAHLFAKIANDELSVPDTWEVALSGGADKKETFTRLITEKRLGYMALLRNLRNMQMAGVDPELIRSAILARRGAGRVLPFRFVAAARAAPRFEPELDDAMLDAINRGEPFEGETVVLVDVSYSMRDRLSKKSDMTRMDAAATLAAVFPGRARVFTFSSSLVEVPQRGGMAGVDAIINSQPHSSTMLAEALRELNKAPTYDRIIVITDEQSTSHVRTPGPRDGARGYMINVAAYENGVGYGRWTHIDGFSEKVIDWIREYERVG